jgi:hypothetical protein
MGWFPARQFRRQLFNPGILYFDVLFRLGVELVVSRVSVVRLDGGRVDMRIRFIRG